MQFNLILCFLLLFTCVLAGRDPNCERRDLEAGQSMYRFTDNGDDEASAALRGSGQVYRGNINQYVEFFIVADVYHGVKVTRLCMFTINVVSVELTVNKEPVPDVYGTPDDVEHFTEPVGDPNNVGRWQKVCLQPRGEIASMIIKFNIGRRRRIKVKKLYMAACQGED